MGSDHRNRTTPFGDHYRGLELVPIGQNNPPHRFVKHFLDLHGLGIRDLARHGPDMLILAGPSMVLDKPSRVLRLRNGASEPLPEAIKADDLEQVGRKLPVGTREDHPDAITVEENETAPRLLVIYDSPLRYPSHARRRPGRQASTRPTYLDATDQAPATLSRARTPPLRPDATPC
jgi:hypothetical protein